MNVLSILTISFLLITLIIAENTCSDALINITGMIPAPPLTYYLNKTQNFQVVELDISTGARCIDGSNYKFYYIPGSNSGKKKFMFLFSGLAYCGSDNLDFLNSCLFRKNAYTQSDDAKLVNGSKYTTNFSWAYFSSEKHSNSLFWNWEKILIPSCDGTLFQGYIEDPLIFNGSELWFRGYNNTLSVFQHTIKHYGLSDAEEIIVTGTSSGGHAAMFWAPFLKNYLNNSVEVKGISDGGILMDVKNVNSNCYLIRKQMQVLGNMSNAYKLDLFKNCKYIKNGIKEDYWKCLLPQYFIEDIEIPFFIMNSQNDYQTLRTQSGLFCLNYGLRNCSSNANEVISSYRQQFLAVLFPLIEKKKQWGFWIRRCLEHYYTNSAAWMSNLTVYNAEWNIFANVKKALYEWYLKEGDTQVSYIDLEDWNNCVY